MNIHRLISRISFFAVLPVLALGLGMPAMAANISKQTNEATGLHSWVAESEGFSIELIQVVPDFIRAIYMSHDFPKAEIDDIAGNCVFGTVIKNTSDQVLTYDVSEWYYTDTKGNNYPVKTKTQWLEQWRKAGVTFSWTLLPDKGTFYAGDWQQGFTTIDLPRKSEFTLTYTWTLDGKPYSDIFEGLSCAPEDIAEK